MKKNTDEIVVPDQSIVSFNDANIVVVNTGPFSCDSADELLEKNELNFLFSSWFGKVNFCQCHILARQSCVWLKLKLTNDVAYHLGLLKRLQSK